MKNWAQSVGRAERVKAAVEGEEVVKVGGVGEG